MFIRFYLVLILSLYSSISFSLTVDEARHLLSRTGFGASPKEIYELLPLTREQAVDKILSGLGGRLDEPELAFTKKPMPDYFWYKNKPINKAEPFWFAREKEMFQLRGWWLDKMISTKTPITEHMALFWHNHFVSSYKGTGGLTVPLYNQLQLFRTKGTESFSSLLHAILKDPAMLIYLNNDLNTKEKPNENLSRELMELFTLGTGHYTQNDVRELAKILTGRSVDISKSWHYVYKKNDHVVGNKTFLGKTGDLNVDDAVEIILENPHTAEFLSRKFYKEFVGLSPNEKAVAEFAKVMRDEKYQIKPYLRYIFLSKYFWDKKNRGNLVKSPVDLVVGFVRTTGLKLPDIQILDRYIQVSGQSLFYHVDVSGWKGGLSWLSSSQLFSRPKIISRLWDAYDDSQQFEKAAHGDLLVRVSGEYSGAYIPAYEVLVNGKKVASGVLKTAINTLTEGDSSVPDRPNPMWQTIVISKSKLPSNIEEVVFHFVSPSGVPKCIPNDQKMSMERCKQYSSTRAIFVNWMQVNGQRFPVEQGVQSYDSDNDITPIGMLYHPARIRFDIAKLKKENSGVNPALLDLSIGKHRLNSIIEHGTTRLPLAMQPAARKLGTPTDFIRELKNYKLVKSYQSVLLSLSPIGGFSDDSNEMNASKKMFLEDIKKLTLDPSYNFK
ncbi:hypothetical protein MSP8886_02808 [Marinomonas spartinae]|uniref:DUF1800 domain-containing protein n=1 Tax=Marinomonas spartinae TaxID=1792290 RepID=A0A1A8TLF3_9GAMM|nr:DUF1800 domain-containing protein [Marinomonas spartinae]SBS33593.1 hypothetical protein MSP8886_02808 [Marinomonas spartinae]